MGIDVAWVTETGAVQDRVFDARGLFSSVILSSTANLPKTCVRFIDPWGDTVFNQAQLPVLLDELSTLQADTQDDATDSHLIEMRALVQRAVDHIHTYVKFIGD